MRIADNVQVALVIAVQNFELARTMLPKPLRVDVQMSCAVWGAAGRGAWPQGHDSSAEVLPERLLG